VTSPLFDYFICVMIILNAVNLGIQTNWVAHHKGEALPFSLTIVETSFALVFLTELILRLVVFRCKFFWMQGWQWNWFDTVVVGLQTFEEVVNLAKVDRLGSMNFSFMRVMRILRLIRVMRLVRVLRLIRELRTLVASIMVSMKALFWTVVLMLLLIYSVSLYVTQLVADNTQETNCGGRASEDCELLEDWYGSVPRSMLTLFQTITGGVDWDFVVRPLSDLISPLVALLITFYIAFSVLALMNVVTGVFVDSVLVSAKEDKDKYLIASARETVTALGIQSVDLKGFRLLVRNPGIVELFKNLDVDVLDAEAIFWLMDTDLSGTVDLEEFISGCLRLKGTARAIDNAMLIWEVRSLRKRMGTVQDFLAGVMDDQESEDEESEDEACEMI